MSDCPICKQGYGIYPQKTLVNWGKSGYMRLLCERHQQEVRAARRVERAA